MNRLALTADTVTVFSGFFALYTLFLRIATHRTDLYPFTTWTLASLIVLSVILQALVRSRTNNDQLRNPSIQPNDTDR